MYHGGLDSPNEVHIAGDVNLDSLGGRWLEPTYPLLALAKMVVNCCNVNNFTQVVDKITRTQFNSVKGETVKSCIDHVYTNVKHRISAVNVISNGASDHDAVQYIRYSK